jgi:hypothetical protein
MIENIKTALASALKTTAGGKPTASEDHPQKAEIKAVKTDADKATMSALGQQLSGSAARAKVRDASMTRDELAAFAKKQKDDFLMGGYTANKTKHDLERPKTSSPELLERAKRATDYVNSSEKGNSYVRNPFSGLARDQLTLIVYDDSGLFTVNERRAAWSAADDLEVEWAKGAIARNQLERSLTGKNPVFLTEVLNHYKALPEIEKVQERYPKNYIAEIEAKIRQETSLPGIVERKKPERVLNLYDILAGMTAPDDKDPDP